MKSIWKFILEIESDSYIEMPKDAKILSVQVQSGHICMWAIVDPEAQKENRYFEVLGTGFTFIDQPSIERTYLGTVQIYRSNGICLARIRI